VYADEKMLDIIHNIQQEDDKATYQKYVSESIQVGRLDINDKIFNFEEKVLLDEKIKIRLPDYFAVMSPDDIDLKYPSPRKPNPIYTDQSTTINIAFNHTSTPLIVKDLPGFKLTMMQMIKKMQPSAQFLEDGIKVINGLSVAFFEFVTSALDGEIYNLACFTPLQERALLINFNCLEVDMAVWRPIAFGIIDSLRLIYQNILFTNE
jgi:hypothetical protein